MTGFDYNYIKIKYEKSFMQIIEIIETENVCEDFSKDEELFDFTKYSKESNLI